MESRKNPYTPTVHTARPPSSGEWPSLYEMFSFTVLGGLTGLLFMIFAGYVFGG